MTRKERIEAENTVRIARAESAKLRANPGFNPAKGLLMADWYDALANHFAQQLSPA